MFEIQRSSNRPSLNNPKDISFFMGLFIEVFLKRDSEIKYERISSNHGFVESHDNPNDIRSSQRTSLKVIDRRF